MLVIRLHKSFSVAGIRKLYSAASLGIDNFLHAKERTKTQFKDIEDKFKTKMSDFSNPDSNNMIFTEDLKHMIHLADGNDSDLQLVKQMMLKFSQQNKEMRFGSFVFGPVVMRMYYYLDKPVEALEAYKALESDGFFDQLISYQILMDLLLKHDMLNEVIEVFEAIKKKQLKGAKYPKNAVVLVLAACYKLNTPASYEYTKKLWYELNEVGHYPMRRAGTFAAALAIQQKEPHVALEILTSMKQQTYITVRNLKVSALADLNRPDDALPLLRAVLDSDRPSEMRYTFCEEVMQKMKEAVDKFGRDEITQEFEKLEKHLRNFNQISSSPLSDFLCSEISSVSPSDMPNKFQQNFTRKRNFNPRPGLKDMI